MTELERKRTIRRRERRRRIRRRRIRTAVLAILVLGMVAINASRAPEPNDVKENKSSTEAMTLEYRVAEKWQPRPTLFETVRDAEPEETSEAEDYECTPEDERIEADLPGKGYLNDGIPLDYELQDLLHTVCEETGVPYALVLAVIEQETDFRNTMGDDGASEGYMQIQERWHQERMERLGVVDLMDPAGNFRVGCDYLAELIDVYGSYDVAVTVYNKGNNPGSITEYGYEVMANYESWKELLRDD